MRTDSFSRDEVIDAVNLRFVCVWKNIRTREIFGDDRENVEIQAVRNTSPGEFEGAGSDNICAIFATADGKIVHAAQGFLKADHFTHELVFAQKLAEEIPKPDADGALRNAYLARLKTPGYSTTVLAARLMEGTLRALADKPLPALADVWNSDTDSAGLVPKRRK